MREIVFSKKAASDLVHLKAFICADSLHLGKKIQIKIASEIRKLSSFPRLGKISSYDQKNEKMRDLIVRDYVIRYLISEKEIWILRVWHGREKKEV